MPLSERIQQHWAELPPTERRVAEFLLAEANRAATYSLTELSQLQGVSKATVSRLFRRLGFDDFNAAREVLRQSPNAGSPLVQRHGGNTDLDSHLAQERANTQTWLGTDRLDALIEGLYQSRRLYCLGLRNNFPLALHAETQWLQLRAGVQALPRPGQSLSEQLGPLESDDWVVLFGLRRRHQGFRRLVSQLLAGPAKLVLISEPGYLPPGKPDHHLVLPLESTGPFASYSAPMSWVALIANGMMQRFPQATRDRIERIEQSYHRLDELEP
ncbi:MurR/RpiR family transcriptional regulator [Saccharospirillum mangrovi]|uniref:MurR/RpiR family transcriptional regulator n=1 Tax=Saccharospirillum mangrovi TaxID=2161747 RepID=UPI00130055A1|nr:MurR/RpiR family transcriptional regulator [Saccharospirillum mangrovi]